MQARTHPFIICDTGKSHNSINMIKASIEQDNKKQAHAMFHHLPVSYNKKVEKERSQT